MKQNHRFNPVWNEEKTKALIGLISEGKNFRAAAEKFGVTRNTVIGAYDRARRRGDIVSAKFDTIPSFTPLPPINRCCWTRDDPSKPFVRWCWRPVRNVGEPWCAEHRKVVFVPVKS